MARRPVGSVGPGVNIGRKSPVRRSTGRWRSLGLGLLGAFLASLAGAGCGGDTAGTPDEATPPSATPTMADDLVAAVMAEPAPGEPTFQSAVTSSRDDEPKVFYLHYADGNPMPKVNYDPCSGKTPPKFVCQFAPTLVECQRQIQAYLDAWYADFNVVFTFTRPTSGKYYTEVISSGGGAWCEVADSVAGVAPFLCKDLKGGVAYAFRGGQSAKETAVIIAQEQAHLMGLEHTRSARDLMYPTICTDCDGFPNVSEAVDGDRCDRASQNSYQMMMDALGPWRGGPKPSPFGCIDDQAPPTVTFLSPADGVTMGHDFTVKLDVRDDCDLAKVQIAVTPLGLTATAHKPPYEWDLTGITGPQTITVTATDAGGRSATATLAVNAPEGRSEGATDGRGAGCTVASGAFGAVGLFPSLAMLLLFSGHRRRSRFRRVTGELAVRGRRRSRVA
jgi:hypothetical protein